MNEYDSPSFASFTYEVKNEGKTRILRGLMLIGYIIYLLAFFLVCYISRFIPLFALAPLSLWIVIFFTWKLVSYDCYFEFRSGMLELGTVRINKKGVRCQKPKVTIRVKDAISATIYNPSPSASKPEISSENASLPQTTKKDLAAVNKIYDFSASPKSDKRIVIIFEENGKRAAAIFEGTAKVANLIASYCERGKSLKGQRFHG